MPVSTASLCRIHATIKELLYGFSHTFLRSYLISWLVCWVNLWATWLLLLLVLRFSWLETDYLSCKQQQCRIGSVQWTAWPRWSQGQWRDEPLSHGESLREAERTGNSSNNENFSYLQGKLHKISCLDIVLGMKVWISKITSPLNR